MQDQNRPSEEIDLLYFFSPIGRGFRKLSNALGRYFMRLRQNLLLFIGILVLAGGIGYSSRFVLPKLFRTNAVFVSHNLPSFFCIQMLDNLNDLAKNYANIPVVAQQLNLSQEAAGSIRSLDAQNLETMGMFDKRDTSLTAFKVTLIARNEQSIPEIQKGVEYFLENNAFAVRRREAHRRTLEAVRNDLIKRISSLDSLKGILSRSVVPQSNGQGIILGQPISPIVAYQVQQDYYRQLQDIEERLSLLTNIEVVQPFSRMGESNYPNFHRLFLYSLILGFVLALLLTPLIGRR